LHAHRRLAHARAGKTTHSGLSCRMAHETRSTGRRKRRKGRPPGYQTGEGDTQVRFLPAPLTPGGERPSRYRN